MFEGLRLTTLAFLVVPAALFSRRARAGQQDELGGIGDDALDLPGDEVAPVPAAVFAPLNPNRPVNAQRSLPILGIEPGAQELPYERMPDAP